MNNKEKLERLYEDIKNIKKLSLPTIKKLYNDMINTSDIVQKKIIREKILIGSLSYIYDIFKESIFLNIESIDIEDIINNLVEEWIGVIDSGEIINVYNIKSFLEYKIIKRLYRRNLAKDKFRVNCVFEYNNNLYLFDSFFDKINNYGSISYNEFLLIIKGLPYKYFYDHIDSYLLLELYNSLNNFFNVVLNSNISLCNKKTKDLFIEYLLYEMYSIEDRIEETIINPNNFIDEVEFNEIIRKIRELFFYENFYNDNEKSVIYYKYGFDGECRSFYDTAVLLQKSKSRVSQLDEQVRVKALSKKGLRKRVLSLKGELDG